MKVTALHIYQFLFCLLVFGLVSACNSKGYQNLTARYNGYFYANQGLEEVNQAIETGYTYNYNDILRVRPDIDSGTINANKSKLEDAFKKASQVIEWHKTSDWVDDSYLIIGKIRHLQAEFALAVSTLQFINQTSDNDDTRHAALIALMRVYMDAGDIDNTEQVATYLDLQELSEQNEADYKITSALFHQRMDETEDMKRDLAEVSDLIKDKNERSRINFILGQLFQRDGENDIAYGFYEASLAGAPPYELDFHARLNMQQVSDFRGSSQVGKIREYYAKLLKDGKNKEYQSKIYYEMGQFEKKQSNYDEALDNYLKAVAVEQPEVRSKSLSYLRAGELYFDIYEKYELASAYYDSTITLLAEDEKGYEEIKKKQQVLGSMVKQLKVIQLNDSLLSLAQMNPVSLDAYLDIYLDEKEEEAKEQAKEARRAQQASTGTNTSTRRSNSFGNNAGSTGEWYFYNDAAMSQGELQFRRQWGDRPLEDNWRRSVKDAVRNDDTEATDDTPGDQAIADTDQPKMSSEARQAEKEKLLATIPTTPEARAKVESEIQEALFELGGIYRSGLKIEEEAANSYQKLVDRYPQSNFKLDALFALYSIYLPKDVPKSDTYKDQIIREYPDSLIAKILIDPQYLEKKEARSRRLQGIYASAYRAYESGNYIEADRIIRSALSSFEDVDFLPTVELLAAVLKSKTESLVSYEQALTAFTEKYPEGPLHDEAKERLAALSERSSQGPKDDEFLYSEDFKQIHMVALVFNYELNDHEAVSKAIDNYNAMAHKDSGYFTGWRELDKEKKIGIIWINTFSTKEQAEQYHNLFKREVGSFMTVMDANFNNFVISRDNFAALFNDKDIDKYLRFYKRFYK